MISSAHASGPSDILRSGNAAMIQKREENLTDWVLDASRDVIHREDMIDDHQGKNAIDWTADYSLPILHSGGLLCRIEPGKK